MIEINVSRTVVLHPGALGDVLLAIPALRALRADRPDDEMVLAAQPRVGTLLTSLKAVDRSLDFDTLGLHTLFTEHAPGEESRRLIAGARVVSWFGSRDAGFARRLRSLAPESVVASSAPAEGLTVWEHLLASVAPVSAGAAGAEARRESIALDADVVDAGRRALTGAGWDGVRPVVILHPGAGGVAKRWAVEGFALLAEAVAAAFGGEIVVHEGPAALLPAGSADRFAVSESTASPSGSAAVMFTVSGAFSAPATLAGAVHHAALWVGNDSGVSHLAAAVGIPALVLFVAANLGWRSWAPAARVRVVSVDALARTDVDAVIADAGDLLRSRAQRVSLARGSA